MKQLALFILFSFTLAVFAIIRPHPEVNVGVTSLVQYCTAQAFPINTFNLTTAEQAPWLIYDLFSGNNLQLTITGTGPQGAAQQQPVLTANPYQSTPNGGLQLVGYDVYQSNQVQLMKDANQNYFVQQWTYATATSGPTVLGGVIALGNAATAACFSVKYLNSFIVAVDCEDMTLLSNYLYFADFTTKQIDLVSPTGLLHDNTISTYDRDMQVIIQTERVYILRTTLFQNWVAAATVNMSTVYTYTEVVRVLGLWTTMVPVQVFSLPPIQYPGMNMNMQVVGIVQNSGKLYLIDQLNKAVWQITLDFTYISYIQDIQQMGIRGSMTQPLAIASSQFNTGSLIIAYQGFYQGQSGVYMEQFNPNTFNAGAVYLLDSSTTQIYQISFGAGLIYAIYSNSVNYAFSVYLTNFNTQMPPSTTTFQPMIYQSILPLNTNLAMIVNEVANTILITYTNTTGQYQALWNAQYPILNIASPNVGATIITIQCYSGFQPLNQTTPVPTTTQATQTITFNFVSPNQVVQINNPFGPYSTTIGAQTMSIQTPGLEVVDLDQFYIAPALQYTVTLTPSAVSSGWSTDLFNVYTTYQQYINNTFVFVASDGTTINVNSIQFIQPFLFLSGRFSWAIQANNNKYYYFIEDPVAAIITFQEIYSPVDLTQIVGTIISSQTLGLEQFVYVGTLNQCMIYFYTASHTQQLWSTTFCDPTQEKIIKLKVFGSQVYAVVQATNAETENSIVTFSVSNQTFRSQANFNQMASTQQLITGSFFTNIQLANFTPLDVFPDFRYPDIIYIKCAPYVLIYNIQMNYVLYQATPTWTTPTNYAVAVTNSSLVLIQTNRIEEYLIYDLTRIYKIRSQYPYYGTQTPSYLIADKQYAFSSQNLYIYEQSTKQLQVFITGLVPMIFMLFDVINIATPPTFLFLTNQYQSKYDQIILLGTQFCGIYNVYYKRTLSVTGYFNNTLPQQTPQTYQFTLMPSSLVGTPTTPFSPITYTATMTSAPFTNISLNSGINMNFITLTSQAATTMLFYFPSFQWFSGTVTRYYLASCDQPSECNQTIFMQSPIGPDRVIGNDPFRFWDMAPGLNNFSFVQVRDKVLRLTGYDNKIFDLVQLPFGEMYRNCLKIAVDPLAQYSVSACTDFSMEGWQFYFVSYLSTEPHLMGRSYDARPVFIDKMIILGNILFIVEANVLSNGIIMYQIDFNEDFGDSNAQQYTLPAWLMYKGTVILNNTMQIPDVINVDVQPTANSQIFRLFLASSSGQLLVVDVNPQSMTPQNLIVAYTQMYFPTTTSSLDPTFQALASQPNFDITLGAFKSLKYNSTTQGDQYTFIIAFKYYNAYEFQSTFYKSSISQFTTISTVLKIRYQKYSFYEFQNNIKVLPGQGFVTLSGFLPEYLTNTNSNYSLHLFIAYDRTNGSLQQYPVPGKSFVDSYIMGAYPFNNRAAYFPYMTQTFYGLSANNYSITLLSPDNFTFISYTLQRQAGVRIMSGAIQSNNIQFVASSEFQTYTVSVGIGRQFPKKKKNKRLWIIGAVLGPIGGVIVLALAFFYYKKRQSGQAYTLGEENSGQQGVAEGK